MAIVYVGGQTGQFAGKTGTTTVTMTSLTGGAASAPAAGDLVVVAYAVGSTADRALTITNASSVDYTLLGTELYANDLFDANLRVAYRVMPSPTETQFILSGTGNVQDAGAYTIQVFRNVHADVIDTATITATNINTRLADPAAITPVTGGTWVYCAGAAAMNTGGTFTHPSLTNFIATTQSDTNDVNIGSGYYSGWLTGAGAYNPAAFAAGGTDTTDDSWAAVTVALKAAADPKSMTPGVGVATFTGFAPTVVGLNPKNVTPGVGAVTLTGFAPTVVATNHRVVTPGVGAATFTGFAPTVTAGANTVVTPGTGVAVWTGLAPTVVASDHKTVSPGTGTATFTGFAPTVEVSSGVGAEVTPGTGIWIATGYAPTWSTSSPPNIGGGGGGKSYRRGAFRGPVRAPKLPWEQEQDRHEERQRAAMPTQPPVAGEAAAIAVATILFWEMLDE